MRRSNNGGQSINRQEGERSSRSPRLCARGASILMSRLESEMSDGANPKQELNPSWISGMLRQGWIGVACWMAVGLLLEGLLGYKAPGYLHDTQRRELFRLAHTHGTLLSMV